MLRGAETFYYFLFDVDISYLNHPYRLLEIPPHDVLFNKKVFAAIIYPEAIERITTQQLLYRLHSQGRVNLEWGVPEKIVYRK